MLIVSLVVSGDTGLEGFLLLYLLAYSTLVAASLLGMGPEQYWGWIHMQRQQ